MPVPARSCGSRRARAALVSARCVRLSGVTATRCTDLSRAATITRFRARSCWARCAAALASKLADGKLTVVDTLEIKEAKTKLYREALDKLDVTRTALLVENGKTLSQALMLGARNLEGVELVLNNEVHPYDLLRYERAIFSKAAIEQLTEALEKSVSKRSAARKLAAQTEAA